MQAHINIKLPGATLAKWVIIELQGKLECESGEDFKSKFIGDLHFTNKGVPILIIGHHILVGKVLDINKPLLTIEKTSTDSNTSSVNYVVKSVITKKLLFKSRPKPITITETN